jgi:hypothetical protein
MPASSQHPAGSRRDLFAHTALARIPKILMLMDRNPHSPTYGCCDRNYWHYRIIDFPSGMAQEFVWPLALAYHTDVPGNPFFGSAAVRDWAIAGIRFAAASAHADGSCDDYYPHERALGAGAFSLLATIECYKLLDVDDEELLGFFRKRASWLASSEESGRLSNHQALVILCLQEAGRLLETREWDDLAEARLERLLGWQTEDGSFPEYEGFDPGYESLTVSVLARVLEEDPQNARLADAIDRAAQLISAFIHPDGSFGGAYGSRNTYAYYPHGMELVGRRVPEALEMNDRFLAGLALGKAACYEDDHVLAHEAWNYLLAWRDFAPDRPEPTSRREGTQWFESAGVLVDRRDDTHLYVAARKGGVFKLFRGGELVGTDTQVSMLVKSGRQTKNAVAHLMDDYVVERGPDSIRISGHFGWAKSAGMTTGKLVVLRFVMAGFGRFFPDLVRKLLQRLLIVGKSRAPFTFERTFSWHDGRWHVRDEIHASGWKHVKAVGIGSDQTSIYVVMSRPFQTGQLGGWTDLTSEVRDLRAGESLVLNRSFPP